jgi:agmatine/peptidylarginine deiminase
VLPAAIAALLAVLAALPAWGLGEITCGATPGRITASGFDRLDREPLQPVRMCAEWEPAFGTLIRWPLGIPSSLVIELASDDSLYVLVETQSQENQARSAFASWDIDLDVVRFIRADTYTHWTRDWGPHSVFDGDGIWGITDPIFDGYPWVPGCFIDGDAPTEPAAGRRALTQSPAGMPELTSREPQQIGVRLPGLGRRGHEEDDAVNAALAEEFGCPLHTLPAYCTGGNIMVDGHGIAFSTRRMVNENAPLWNEEQFRQLAETYMGIHSYHFLDDPEVHGIQHTDCYAKLLDEETVLIKQVPYGHPEYECVERLAQQVAAQTNCYGRPYRIVRIYCGSCGGNAVAAYTNSLILNKKVLVPLFGIAWDDDALLTFEEALPGYEVIGFQWSQWYYYDALHCRTMAIFDRHMLRIWHRRMDAEVQLAPQYEVVAMIDDRSQAGLIPDELQVHWRREGEPTWNAIPLTATAGPDSFVAIIPYQPPETTVEYFLAAADSSGRYETLPRSAPEGFYSFTVVRDPAEVPPVADGTPPNAQPQIVWIQPNPFRSAATIRLALPSAVPANAGPVILEIHDVAGRRVRTLLTGSGCSDLSGSSVSRGMVTVHWNGRNDLGERCATGIYLIALRAGGSTSATRVLMIR